MRTGRIDLNISPYQFKAHEARIVCHDSVELTVHVVAHPEYVRCESIACSCRKAHSTVSSSLFGLGVPILSRLRIYGSPQRVDVAALFPYRPLHGGASLGR